MLHIIVRATVGVGRAFVRALAVRGERMRAVSRSAAPGLPVAAEFMPGDATNVAQTALHQKRNRKGLFIEAPSLPRARTAHRHLESFASPHLPSPHRAGGWFHDRCEVCGRKTGLGPYRRGSPTRGLIIAPPVMRAYSRARRRRSAAISRATGAASATGSRIAADHSACQRCATS